MPDTQLREHWKSSGGRHTGQRDRILTALERHSKPVTAQELFISLSSDSSQKGASLATVYRTLNSLSAAGLVDTLRRESGEVTFLLCHQGHHHHLTCRHCGLVQEVRDCKLKQWTDQIASEYSFVAVEHRAELTGTCSECAGQSR